MWACTLQLQCHGCNLLEDSMPGRIDLYLYTAVRSLLPHKLLSNFSIAVRSLVSMILVYMQIWMAHVHAPVAWLPWRFRYTLTEVSACTRFEVVQKRDSDPFQIQLPYAWQKPCTVNSCRLPAT
jgi:hypothetical protein